MANVALRNADNVDCLYAGQTLSLFMKLTRPSGVVALCADSTIEDVPIVFSLTLQRVGDTAAVLPTSTRHLHVVRRPRDDGEADTGADLVTFAVEHRELLKVTVDLATCAERSQELSQVKRAATEHTLVDQAWTINEAFTLRFQLRATAHAAWPAMPSLQYNELSTSSSYVPPTPRSSHHHYLRDTSESVRFFGDDSLARPPSTVRSMTSRTTRLFNPSEPRSQLQRAIFVDQTLFPIIRILFVPELFTKTIDTPPNMVWNMSLQVTVSRSTVRKPRRTTARERVTERASRRGEAARKESEAVNLSVEESVLVSSADWEEGAAAKSPREVRAIALSFNADLRFPAGEGGAAADDEGAVDVARVSRLTVDEFTFDVLVSAKHQAEVQVEEILRTVYSYCGEHEEVDSVVDLDLDDLMQYIYDRYAYMKMTPYYDGMSFHDTVWEAVRLYLINSMTEGDVYDSDVDDSAMLLDGVLANA